MPGLFLLALTILAILTMISASFLKKIVFCLSYVIICIRLIT